MTLNITHEITSPASPSRGTLVFIHGWPDDASLWAGQVPRMVEEGYRCVCVTLPGFGPRQKDSDPGGVHHRAHSFVAVADALARLIREEIAPGDGEQVILVCHDWGSYYGFYLENLYPQLVCKMIVMDVGPPLFGRRPSWKTVPLLFVVGLIYQYWLILAWLLARCLPWCGIGRALGDGLARLVARVTGVPKVRRDAGGVTARCCYPYWVMHRNAWLELLGLKKPDGTRPASRAAVPRCPCLFFWGSGKGFRFHTRAWERALLARTDGSKVVALERAKHWLMLDCREEVNNLVAAWLAGEEG